MWKLGTNQICRCPCSLNYQGISNHDIDCVKWSCSCLPWGSISTSWSISLWSNDIPCDHVFLFLWGRVMHICVGKLAIIGSDNGFSPDWCQAIIWTNVGILLTGPLRTNVNEILIRIHAFLFKKLHLKMLSGKWRPLCLGLNVLKS